MAARPRRRRPRPGDARRRRRCRLRATAADDGGDRGGALKSAMMGESMSAQLHQWLDGFALDEFLRRHVAVVMVRLPDHVRDDFLDDPGFVLCDYEPTVGAGTVVPVGPPRRNA